MAEITLLKLELKEGSFTANAPFSGRTSSKEESVEEDEEDSRRLLPLVAGLVFLVALTVVVRKVRGGSDDIEDEIETETETTL